MFLSDMYSRLENNNSLEGGTPEYVEKQDWSQSKCPSMNDNIRKGGSSILYSGLPWIDSIRQSQHALIGDSIYEGDSGHSAYAQPLNAGNVISNSFSVHHETSGGETENNSTELNPSLFCKDRNLRKQDEPSGLSQDEGSNVFLENRDFVVGKASSFTAGDKKGKRKPRKAEVAANIPAGRRDHMGFKVTRTEKRLNPSLISRPSGSKDRHTMVLTSKGPRDRRMRLSVGTAIKLYCIQDMLSFEQPSQAVEWLIEKSQEAILELPQVASISSSHISQYVDSTTADASLSRLQTGDPSTSSKENTASTASRDCLVNHYQQILEAKTWIDQKSSTATTTESNNKNSIVQEGKRKRDQRSLALSSVASNCRTRETANPIPRKLFRDKARERARERTKQKEKHHNLEREKSGILQSTLVRSQSPTSCLNMVNETADGDSNSNAFLHSLMLTKDSVLDSESRLCRNPPAAEILCSSLASAHYYNPQQEGSSLQSTGAFSGLHPGTFHLPSGQFPQAVPAPNTSSSQGVFCTYPLDHEDLESNNLCRCCTVHSIEMPCSYDGALESLYERQSSSHKGSCHLLNGCFH